MANKQPDRIIALLSSARIADRELREFFKFVKVNGDAAVLNAVRNFESRIFADSGEEGVDASDYLSEETYRMVDEFRLKEFKVPVGHLIEEMSHVLRNQSPQKQVPDFHQKMGLRKWVSEALRTFTPSEIYQVIAIIRERDNRNFDRAWSIR
jgi:hypothetical protein